MSILIQFTITKKWDTNTYTINIKEATSNIQDRYRYTKNVNLSVLPSQ